MPYTQFNNIIYFNTKIFNKQIKYGGIDSLNYVHNLESVSVSQCLNSDYEIKLSSEKDFIFDEEISAAVSFEEGAERNSEDGNLKQLISLNNNYKRKNNNFTSQLNGNKFNKSFKIKSSMPTDQSGRLLRRLVSATGQFEITQVLSSANRAITTMRMAVAMCETQQQSGSMRAAIRKLEKIINRCEIKSKQLKEEEDLRLKSKDAEKRKREKLKETIKKELNERIRKRKIRESGWLREVSYGTLNKKCTGKNNRKNDDNRNDDKGDTENIEIALEFAQAEEVLPEVSEEYVEVALNSGESSEPADISSDISNADIGMSQAESGS